MLFYFFSLLLQLGTMVLTWWLPVWVCDVVSTGCPCQRVGRRGDILYGLFIILPWVSACFLPPLLSSPRLCLLCLANLIGPFGDCLVFVWMLCSSMFHGVSWAAGLVSSSCLWFELVLWWESGDHSPIVLTDITDDWYIYNNNNNNNNNNMGEFGIKNVEGGVLLG